MNACPGYAQTAALMRPFRTTDIPKRSTLHVPLDLVKSTKALSPGGVLTERRTARYQFTDLAYCDFQGRGGLMRMQDELVSGSGETTQITGFFTLTAALR